MIKLTTCQIKVATLVSQGRANKQVAYDLGISEQTVKNHLHSVYDKLGIENRAQLVAKMNDEPDIVRCPWCDGTGWQRRPRDS